MQTTFIDDPLKKPVWALFLCSWLFYLIGLFLFSHMVWDANTYQYDFEGTDFETTLSNWRRMDMIRYILSPFWILGISAIIWLLIKSGLVVLHIELNKTLLLKIIFLGLIFLALPFWIKSIWFVLLKGSYVPDDVKYFFPGTIISIINTSGMNETKIKALEHINLFHLAFMLFTSWQISVYSNIKYFKSFLVVLCTYGFGLAFLNYFRILFFG